MTPFEEYKNITTHKDRLFKSWWENVGKWKSPDKLNEGIWHRLREVEENAPTMETGIWEWIRKQPPSKLPTEKELNKLK